MNHYTIFAVRSKVDDNMKVKLIVDSVIRYTDDDVVKVQYAQSLLDNKLFGVKNQIEAFNLAEVGHYPAILKGLSLRAHANSLTVHKLVTNFELDDETLDTFVSSCEVCKSSQQKLRDSKINI